MAKVIARIGAGALRRVRRAAGRVAAHRAASAAARQKARDEEIARPRLALQNAIHDFAYANHPDPKPAALDATAIRHLNQNLQRFLATAGLRPRFTLATFDRAASGPYSARESCIAEIAGNAAILRFPANTDSSWLPLLRMLSVVPVMDAMFNAGPVSDAIFQIELGDSCYHRSAGFCAARADGCLLPDPDFIATGGYATARRMVQVGQTPWRQRADTIFWRGTTTGHRRCAPPPPGAADDFAWLPRLDMCRRTRQSPLAARYDVGITAIVQIDEPELAARVTASGLFRPQVPREGFLGHKAIIVIDGNANAWSALFLALLTGACVFKVDSPRGFKQWYYDALISWVHYVPVSADLADLDERAAWLLAHDAQAEAIGRAGRLFAEAMNFETERDPAARRLRSWLPQGQLQ